MKRNLFLRRIACWCSALALLAPLAAPADETCNSPYMANLITGQEDYVHVWTLGVAGMGDGNDKLVTVDVNPRSGQYGKVIGSVAVPGRGEAHHMGFTDDRKYLWAGRLEDNKIFVFDVGTDPAKPRLVKTIGDVAQKTGFAGPHTFYALPGRMLLGFLSNAADAGGVTGMAVYNNRGDFVARYPMPVGKSAAGDGDGYNYDLAVNPQKNALLTSSFTGLNNYMSELGQLIKNPEAMKRFGNTMVLWDLKAMKPKKVFNTPGAPLEIRWSLREGDNWAISASALSSKLWLVQQDGGGEWQARDVGNIGDPAKTPLPVDISLSADGRRLWVNTFMDGKTRLFDLSNPRAPAQIYEKTTGKHVNMVSQSWDGKRVYITTSLLSKWDLDNDDQFLKLYSWDGKELKEQWKIDFYREKLGRPHHMKFTAEAHRVGAPKLAAAH
ncbi:selenium-binding protein SBP56-related protein [Janthinobacterium fluminis]|uniref:Methanethiol oxidase n=1 Tax=Janthinobacterium fluminis TaxID=2987524 RepID=A0ABT5JXK8_9BURK|nr:selenium-binding protein SBP56-related protein [Janthinobacterium fluminis]MDC8756883.1 selenium-binding protein SBP56-related protein [Janthinobacterium fluminis]